MSTPASGPQPDHDPADELLRQTMNESPAAAAYTTGTHTGPASASGSGSAPAVELGGHESPHIRSGSGRTPSPPWYGAIQISILALMTVILLTYTLLDWDWQQRLGGWNYVAVIALIPAVSVLMRRWVPDDTL